MDMKKILQSLDKVKTAAPGGVNDMKRFVSIISESQKPLNRLTTAESMAVNHYTQPTRPNITSPVLNVAEGATPSMIGKYFKQVEQELAESAERSKDRAHQLAEMVAKNINEKAVSKSQQRFMGMVHAAQKGEKAASPEVAKVAKGMSKKAGHDYAATKHKGLPDHVKESSSDVCPQCGMKGCTCAPGKCNCKPKPGYPKKQDESLKSDNPCWKGYHPVGTKKKGGRTVPNCVPSNEAVNPAQQAAIAIAKKKKKNTP